MKEDEKTHNTSIPIALPNGIVITLIGFFLCLTPFATELEPKEEILDWIAGGLLLVGGIGLTIVGWRGRKQNN